MQKFTTLIAFLLLNAFADAQQQKSHSRLKSWKTWALATAGAGVVHTFATRTFHEPSGDPVNTNELLWRQACRMQGLPIPELPRDDITQEKFVPFKQHTAGGAARMDDHITSDRTVSYHFVRPLWKLVSKQRDGINSGLLKNIRGVPQEPQHKPMHYYSTTLQIIDNRWTTEYRYNAVLDNSINEENHISESARALKESRI